MKKQVGAQRIFRRAAAFLMMLILAFTSVPFSQTAHAAPSAGSFDPSLSYYSYVRMKSLTTPYRTMAVNYIQSNSAKLYSALVAGELSYLKYALPYNMDVKMEVYDLEGKLLGPVYGRRYVGQVSGNAQDGYTLKEEFTESRIRDIFNDVYKTLSSDPKYAKTIFGPQLFFPGFGLTGEPLPYKNLRGYYASRGLDYPVGTLQESLSEPDSLMPSVSSSDTALPSGEIPESAPESASQPTPAESESAPESASQPTPDESESAPESASQPTPSESESAPESASQPTPAESENALESASRASHAGADNSFLPENQSIVTPETSGPSAPQAAPAAAAKADNAAIPETTPVSATRASAVSLPAEVKVPADTKQTEEKQPSPETDSGFQSLEPSETDREATPEPPAGQPTNEELAERYYLSVEDMALMSESSWEELHRMDAGEDPFEGVPEEELPADFYISAPDYSEIHLSDLQAPALFSVADGADGVIAGITGSRKLIYNYLMWRGQYFDQKEKQAKYLPAGQYLILVSPVNTSAAGQSVCLQFEIRHAAGAGGGEANPDDLPPEQIEQEARKQKSYSLLPANGFFKVMRQKDGDPVDMVTGALEWSYADLSIEGQKSLAFTRTYHSNQCEEDTAGLGYGWSHNWNYKADIFMGDVEILLPGGGRIFYTLDDSGRFQTTAGNAYRLEYDGSKYYLTNTATGAVVTFDKDGRSQQLTESDGAITTFTHDGDRLVKIANDTGSLTLVWSGEHIASVTDSAGRTVTFEVNGGDLTKATNPDGDALSYTYDAHKLLTVTDFNGAVMLENVYDADGRVREQTMPDRGRMTYTYDAANRKSTYTEEGGATRTTVYDDKFRAVSVTDESGTRSYAYDELSRMVAETDQNGSTTRYTYAGDTCRPESVTCPDGATEHYAYTESGLIATLTQKDGTTLSYTYENGKLVNATDANGGVTRYAYDERGYLRESTDALGHTTAYTTDDKGNITSSTDPLGSTTKYEYDGAGRLTKQTSPLGHTYTYTYSAAGKLVTETDPMGNTRTHAYTGNGFETLSTDWLGAKTVTEYSGMNDRLSVTDPMGVKTAYTYDGQGNVLTQTDADGCTIKYAYDTVGRLVSSTDGNGNATRFTYDGNGNVTAITDPFGSNGTITYDAMNRAVTTTDKNGHTTTYTRDAMGRVTAQTDAGGRTTCYTYDANGNVTSITDPRGNTTQMEYDAENRLTKTTTAEGIATSYAYDAAGKLISVTTAGIEQRTTDDKNQTAPAADIIDGENVAAAADNTTDAAQGTPDSATDKKATVNTGVTNTAATVQAAYDADGRLIRATDAEGRATAYEYDALGRIVKKTNPDASAITYTYDANGNILTTTDGRGSTTAYAYDAAGRMTKITDPEGHVTAMAYTPAGKLASITDAEGGVVSYAYDANGNPTKVTDARGNATLYAYDALNRLTAVTDPEGGVTAYAYDAAGNRTAITTPNGGSFTTAYDKTNQPVSETDAEGHTAHSAYDANGNLTSYTNRRGYTTQYAYDKDNRLTTVTDALGGVTTYAYDALGRITAVTYADGSAVSTLYNKNGEAVSATDQLGSRTTCQYDSMGRVSGVTGPDGAVTRYTYDANGNLLTATDAEGNTTRYAYDKNDLLLTETDPLNGTTTYTYTPTGEVASRTDALQGTLSYTYDANGNLIKLVDAEGHAVAYAYDKNNRAVSATDAEGNTASFVYDKNGNLIEIHNPDGGVEKYAYDGNNQVISYTDGEGYATRYAYDENGNKTAILDAKGQKKTAEYDALDRRVKTVDEAGNAVTLSYDSMGRVTEAVNEDGGVTKYAYDAKGQVIAITDALDHAKQIEYDARGNVLSETDEAGVKRCWTYDALNRVTSYTDGLGNATAYAYDANGNLLTKTDAKGNTVSYTYDALNRPVTETDGNGHTKTFTYDKNSRITAVTDAKGGVTRYVLDGNSNVVEQTDALGHSSYFEYDSMNRLMKIRLYSGEETNEAGETVPTGEQMTLYTYDKRGLVTSEINAKGDGKTYVYDELGNLISKTDEDGYVTEQTYDPVGNVSAIKYQDGREVRYAYNATGELVQMTDWNGTTTIGRDLLNRITEVNDHNGRATGYAWDAVGRLAAITFPDGTANTYTYDAEGRQLTATDNKGKEFTFAYDANGNLTEKWYPNGELERYQYDAANQRVRLDEYAINGIQKTYTEYTYDANGNRTGDKNRVPTTPEKNYQYTGNTGTWGGDWNEYTFDALNRLVREYEHDTNQSVEYAYDSLGNRILEKDNRETLHYTYNELNQLVQKKAFNGITTYQYDKRGNRVLETSEHTQENRRTYTWDATNHLASGTRGTDWNFYQSAYTYNGLGMRINSTIEGPEHTVYDRDYLIDYTSPERNDLAEYNVGHYQWQGTKKVHDLKYLYTADGQRLEVDALHYSQWGGSDTRYTLNMHEDILGSATAYTYQGGWNDGQWANKHEFDVWGYNSKSPTYNYDPMYRSTEPYFTGHQFDGSLNIYYADARFYDAETGTWLSPDPIKDGMNWYVYCGNNPVTFVDFTGLFADNYFTNLAGSDFEGDYTLYVNGKKMEVSRQGNDLRPKNSGDQITLLKEAGLISDDKSTVKEGYMYLTVSDIARHIGAENTFSTWKESDDEMITVFNPAMKDQGVRVTRYGCEVKIDVNAYFSGDKDVAPGKETFSQLAIDGIESWAGTYYAQEQNGIRYDSFGVYDAVHVTVNVNETNKSENALEIGIYDNRNVFRTRAYDGNNISHTATCVAEDPDKMEQEYIWHLNTLGAITLYPTRRLGKLGGIAERDDENYKPEYYQEEKFVSIVRHEFGHILGLDEAYGLEQNYDGAEISQEEWPVGDVMWHNGPVTSNDVEMMLEAWKLNQIQEFSLDNLSPVIRLDVTKDGQMDGSLK